MCVYIYTPTYIYTHTPIQRRYTVIQINIHIMHLYAIIEISPVCRGVNGSFILHVFWKHIQYILNPSTVCQTVHTLYIFSAILHHQQRQQPHDKLCRWQWCQSAVREAVCVLTVQCLPSTCRRGLSLELPLLKLLHSLSAHSIPF